MKQSIIYGIVGLVIGAVISGAVVATQITASSKKAISNTTPTAMVPSNDDMGQMDHSQMSVDDMSMGAMMTELQGKSGDEFDKVFLQAMIAHHYGAVDMAKAAKTDAGHQELKDLADEIISAQDKEIKQMQQWQKDWGYTQ